MYLYARHRNITCYARIIKIKHYVCFCIYFGLMKSQTFDFARNQKFALGLIPISVLQYVDIDLHTVVFFFGPCMQNFYYQFRRIIPVPVTLCILHLNVLKRFILILQLGQISILSPLSQFQVVCFNDKQDVTSKS